MKLRVPRLFRHDLLRKLIAVFFALVVWLAVSAQLRQTVVVQNVTVTLSYDETETIIESEFPKVNVTVWGSPRALEQLRSSDIRIAAKVGEVTPGDHSCTIGISKRNVTHTPPGIRVVSIDQERIRVRVDRYQTREDIPVTVRFEGGVHEGYRRTRRKVTPDTVVLRGPHRLVKDIREVTTETVMLDDTMVRDFSMDVPLSRIVGVEMPKTVRLEVWIAQASGDREYRDLPLVVLAPPVHRLEAVGELPQVSLTVQGPETALANLAASQVHTFVDLTSVQAPGQHDCRVRAWIEDGNNLLVQNIKPERVSLNLVPIVAQPTPAAPAPEEPPKGKQPPKTPAPAEKEPAKPAPKTDAPK